MAHPATDLPADPEHSRDFVAIERLEQHIIAARVQDLGPQALVGTAGHNRHERWIRAGGAQGKQILPSPIRQVTLANDHSDFAESFRCVAYRSVPMYGGAIITEHRAEVGFVAA
jgi:hypothetical protein